VYLSRVCCSDFGICLEIPSGTPGCLAAILDLVSVEPDIFSSPWFIFLRSPLSSAGVAHGINI